MRNVSTNTVTVNSIMRTKEFRIGMSHYHRGLPADAFINGGTKEIWHYERGRLFAACYPKVTVKDVRPTNGRVDGWYQQLFSKAVSEGSML